MPVPNALPQQLLGGWGNYPVQLCSVVRPETLDGLRSLLAGQTLSEQISRGLGRAYGDSALNPKGGVILFSRLNRFLHFDPLTGVLECEAGVSLGEIIEIFLPRGWFPPVVPGTRFVTVGGAIAADIHGKNHHRDGSFGHFVDELTLVTAANEKIVCSPLQQSEVFWATVGGMGLTGCIVSARIRLQRIVTGYVDVTYRRTHNLDETLEAFATGNRSFRYSVAWIDCLASGKAIGRSVLMLGNDATFAMLPHRWKSQTLRVPSRRTQSMPILFPSGTLNAWTVKALNEIYYRSHRDARKLVSYDNFFFPLDNLHHWNRIYGKRGFVQYQVLFPLQTARQGLVELLETIARSGRASFLAVLKEMGPATPGLLSFPMPGWTLALDIPHTGNSFQQDMQALDRIALRHGGRLYLAKDATTTTEAFQAMYANLSRFKEIKSRLDPNCRFVSSQARRLGIVDTR